MSNSLASLMVKRLSNRPDSEHGQAIVRLSILLIVLVYMLARDYLHEAGTVVDAGTDSVMTMVMIGFGLGSLIRVDHRRPARVAPASRARHAVRLRADGRGHVAGGRAGSGLRDPDG